MWGALDICVYIAWVEKVEEKNKDDNCPETFVANDNKRFNWANTWIRQVVLAINTWNINQHSG